MAATHDVGAPRLALGWHRAFEHSPIAVAVLDTAGVVLLANEQLVALTGLDGGLLVGRSVDELSPDPPLTGSPEWAEIVAGTREVLRGDRRLRGAGGAELTVRLTLSPAEGDAGDVRALVLQAFDVTAARENEIALASRAISDDLTGLSNRWLTVEWLARALAEQPASEVGVLSVDVDRLAAVNESLGHTAGDALIAEVGRRVRLAVDEGDLVGRVSGDGFLVVCEGVSGGDLQAAGDAVLRAMHEPVVLAGTRHAASVCIGAALGTAGDGPDELVRHADLALLRAQAAGGASYASWDPAVDADDGTDLALAWQIRESVGAGELRAYYQPIVSLPERTVTGYEALVRWVHAERGLLLPASFLGTAETNGLIGPIGAWMLHRSVHDAATRMPPDVRVSVNASPLQLARPGFGETVAQELAASGLAAGRLQLEITETALLRAGPALLAEMRELDAMGVRIALDDFGTGYSSLSLLHELPVATVKIDRSFVGPILLDRRARAMVRAVLGMCTDLGVDTVAEGVEDEAQAAALIGMGCTRAQGFLFGRPAPL